MSNNRRRGGGGGYGGRNNNRFGGGSNNNNSSFGGRNNNNSNRSHNSGYQGSNHAEQPDVRLCKFFLLGGAGQCQSSQKPGGCQFAHALQRVADVACSGGGGGNSQQHHVRAVCSYKNASGGVYVFTGSKDGHWRMWDAQTWSLTQDVQMEGEIHALEVDAGHLVCGYEGPTATIPGVNVGMVRAWNLANPAAPYDFKMSEPQPFAHPQPVYCCKMKVDAAPEVYTGGQEGAIHCWGFDAASGGFALKCKLEGHVRGVTSLALFASGGNFLLSGSMDRTLRIWSIDDPARKECAGMLSKNNDGHAEAITAVCPLTMGDAKYFVSGSMDAHLKVWNSSGGCDFTQKCNGAILALDATQDPAGKAVVVIGLVDGTVELRQPDLGFKLRSTLSNKFSVGHNGSVRALCCGEAYFCSVGDDSKLMVWQWVAPLPQ